MGLLGQAMAQAEWGLFELVMTGLGSAVVLLVTVIVTSFFTFARSLTVKHKELMEWIRNVEKSHRSDIKELSNSVSALREQVVASTAETKATVEKRTWLESSVISLQKQVHNLELKMAKLLDN